MFLKVLNFPHSLYTVLAKRTFVEPFLDTQKFQSQHPEETERGVVPFSFGAEIRPVTISCLALCGSPMVSNPGLLDLGRGLLPTRAACSGHLCKPGLLHMPSRQAYSRQSIAHRFKLLSHEGVVITLASHQM